MNIVNNEKLVERLSGEYALGTLKGGARRRFDGLLVNSPVLRRAVAEWQDRLVPMAQFAPVEKPSPQVWRKLAQQLRLDPSPVGIDAKSSFWRSLGSDLAFWRGMGLVSTALATILVGVLVAKQFDTVAPTTSYVAMLSDDQARPIALVTGDPVRHQMTIGAS